MNKGKIEKPKVFISYAWSTEEYQEKVRSFARELLNDGIDVIFDKWSLKEGNDTYSFMEKSVADSSITNALIMLDPVYAIKANNRTGGVGTETQIISPEIYNKTEQVKFIPIVFERGEDGGIEKPHYLKGLLHFDLSLEQSYETEYKRLVHRLYGLDIEKKPDIGNRPAWLGNETVIATKTLISYDFLKSNSSSEIKKQHFEEYMNGIVDKINNLDEDNLIQQLDYDVYLSLYSKTICIRDEFLKLLKYTPYIDNSEKIIASKIEEVCDELQRKETLLSEIQKTLLHEIFIYIIAFYYKIKNYKALSYILTKTYFISTYMGETADSFKIFYFNNEHMDNAVSQRDNKRYHSGTAFYWIDNINLELCSKSEFAFADCLCYNAAIFVENYKDSWFWFPITYAYENKTVNKFAKKLISKEHLKDLITIFGYDDIDVFKKKFSEIKNQIDTGEFREYRYRGSFDNAPIICQFIESAELGSRN